MENQKLSDKTAQHNYERKRHNYKRLNQNIISLYQEDVVSQYGTKSENYEQLSDSIKGKITIKSSYNETISQSYEQNIQMMR